MTDELTSALLTSDFRQLWASPGTCSAKKCIPRYTKLDPALKSVLYEISYDFAQDRTQPWARFDTTLENILHEI